MVKVVTNAVVCTKALTLFLQNRLADLHEDLQGALIQMYVYLGKGFKFPMIVSQRSNLCIILMKR